MLEFSFDRWLVFEILSFCFTLQAFGFWLNDLFCFLCC